MDFTPETLRARFHQLGAERDTILAAVAPLRAARDELVAANREAEAAANAAIREAEAGLFEIDVERGQIARFLDGKTGAPG